MTKGKPKDGSKNPGGRPIKWTEKALIKLGEELLAWFDISIKNIFFHKFLLEKDLYGSMLSDYEEKFKSFSELIKKARKKQEMKILELGMFEITNTTMSIFCLKNHHNYADRIEQKVQDENVEFDW